MGDVDRKAVQDTNRGLSIYLIMGILCANVALLFRIYRKNNKFFYNAKHLTLISLTIGDIFLALFSLIVLAIYNFQPGSYEDMGCRTTVSANVYQKYLLPFVYGIGLCMLASEVSNRQRATTSSSSSRNRRDLAKAFIFSALPWFLGLVIILPLTMAGMDWDYKMYCRNTSMIPSRRRGIYWVSIILPACLAFVSCLLVMCMRSSYQPLQSMELAPGAQSMELAPIAQSMELAPIAPTTTVSTTAPPPTYPNNSDAYGDSDPSKEKITLLLAAIIFALCVIPEASYHLSYVLNDYADILNEMTATLISMFVKWLRISRSLITPLLWLCSSTV